MENGLLEKVKKLNLCDGLHEIEVDGIKANVSKVDGSLTIGTSNRLILSAARFNIKN